MTNDWQKGFALGHLKDLAAPFKETYKRITFGPFGTPKERDVAEALHKRGCTFIRSQSRPGIESRCVAIALWNLLKRPTQQEDFTGRCFEIPAGQILVKHFAFVPGFEQEAAKIIEHLSASRRAIWWTIPEEYTGLKKLIEERARYQTTKISAYSDVIGVYSQPAAGPLAISGPDLPALHPAEHISICRIEPEWASPFDLGAIEAELEKFVPVWRDHYSSYNKRNSWSAFALKGYDAGDPGFIIKPAEMSREWKEQNAERLKHEPALTTAAECFEDTLRIVNRIPGEKQRIRFMKLSKGKGELTRHADITDREAGVAPGRVARLHIPIVTNPRVIFRSWDSRGIEHKVHMEQGGLYYLDQRKPHTAINQGEEDRIHLVIDVVSSETIQRWVAKGEV